VDVVVWMFAGAVQGKAVECGDGRWRPAGAMRESAGMGSPVVPFETAVEWAAVVERGPDGSAVRPLARPAGMRMVATFALPGGGVAGAVVHGAVAELWYVVSGTGELWRRQADREEIIPLRPGVCAPLPPGTAFQFRASPAQSPPPASGAERVEAASE